MTAGPKATLKVWLDPMSIARSSARLLRSSALEAAEAGCDIRFGPEARKRKTANLMISKASYLGDAGFVWRWQS